MNQTAFYLAAIAMMAAGAVLIYLLLRDRRPMRPADAFEWVGVTFSALLIGLALVLIVLTARWSPTGVSAGPQVLQANQVPDVSASLQKPATDFAFQLVDDDREASLEAYRGSVVLLNIWATWCAPCLTELPELNRLQDTYRDQGLVVLTISDEPRSDLQQFTRTRPLRTVSGYLPDPTRLPRPYLQTLNVRPSTFVIDREGVLRSYLAGAGTFESFREMITPYL